MAIYMSCKGQKQGAITGGVTVNQFPGQIKCDSMQFGMGHPVSNSGITTGKQVARPLVITKQTDQSSPLLFNACVNNENLTTVVISYVFEGDQHAAIATTTLTNAFVQDINHEAQTDGSSMETVTFNYQKCEFTWVTGGITSVWDLTA
jgi:type VI secretion system secreted protein Hcp